jgi:hypothetical protein
MIRKQLLELGRQKGNELLGKYPGDTAILSVLHQIEYLSGIEDGSITDKSRLSNITIGVIMRGR